MSLRVVFAGDGPLTVFAPTNEAIEALPASLVASLMEDTEMLKQVLLFHVVAGEITSSMADNNIQLPSVAGPPLLVNLYLKSKYYDVSGVHNNQINHNNAWLQQIGKLQSGSVPGPF